MSRTISRRPRPPEPARFPSKEGKRDLRVTLNATVSPRQEQPSPTSRISNQNFINPIYFTTITRVTPFSTSTFVRSITDSQTDETTTIRQTVIEAGQRTITEGLSTTTISRSSPPTTLSAISTRTPFITTQTIHSNPVPTSSSPTTVRSSIPVLPTATAPLASKSTSIPAVITAALLPTVVFIIVMLSFCCWQRRRARPMQIDEIEMQAPDDEINMAERERVERFRTEAPILVNEDTVEWARRHRAGELDVVGLRVGQEQMRAPAVLSHRTTTAVSGRSTAASRDILPADSLSVALGIDSVSVVDHRLDTRATTTPVNGLDIRTDNQHPRADQELSRPQPARYHAHRPVQPPLTSQMPNAARDYPIPLLDRERESDDEREERYRIMPQRTAQGEERERKRRNRALTMYRPTLDAARGPSPTPSTNEHRALAMNMLTSSNPYPSSTPQEILGVLSEIHGRQPDSTRQPESVRQLAEEDAPNGSDASEEGEDGLTGPERAWAILTGELQERLTTSRSMGKTAAQLTTEVRQEDLTSFRKQNQKKGQKLEEERKEGRREAAMPRDFEEEERQAEERRGEEEGRLREERRRKERKGPEQELRDRHRVLMEERRRAEREGGEHREDRETQRPEQKEKREKGREELRREEQPRNEQPRNEQPREEESTRERNRSLAIRGQGVTDTNRTDFDVDEVLRVWRDQPPRASRRGDPPIVEPQMDSRIGPRYADPNMADSTFENGEIGHRRLYYNKPQEAGPDPQSAVSRVAAMARPTIQRDGGPSTEMRRFQAGLRDLSESGDDREQ